MSLKMTDEDRRNKHNQNMPECGGLSYSFLDNDCWDGNETALLKRLLSWFLRDVFLNSLYILGNVF